MGQNGLIWLHFWVVRTGTGGRNTEQEPRRSAVAGLRPSHAHLASLSSSAHPPTECGAFHINQDSSSQMCLWTNPSEPGNPSTETLQMTLGYVTQTAKAN